MRAFLLLAFASLLAASVAQFECPPTEVVFLLDESENSQRAASVPSTGQNFITLRNALTQFLQNPLVTASGQRNEFRVGAFSYSDFTPQLQSIPLGSSPQSAISAVSSPSPTTGIGAVIHGGSWTFRGLQMLQGTSPTFQNHLAIVISSQGSGDDFRRQQAVNLARAARSNDWNIMVIAVRGDNQIDYQELTGVNNGVPPVNTTYGNLGAVLNNIVNTMLCTRPVITEPPPTQPPSTGICDNCLFEGGYGYDFHREYCDAYYQCFPDSEPLKRECGTGTFWDGNTCNFIRNVNCPQAPCNQFTANGTNYPSGRCCNKYFSCIGGRLREIPCARNEIFDTASRRCVPNAQFSIGDFTCGDNRFVCDVAGGNSGGGAGSCDGYSPDDLGDPCRFNFGGFSIPTPAGTRWDQDSCSLMDASDNICGGVVAQQLGGGEPAAQCNAVFLATYDLGSRNVTSPRRGQDLDVFLATQEVRLEQNAVVFDQSMRQPYAYYYFFNNRDFQPNFAMRVKFRLDQNAPQSDIYDVLSNNYCPQCPATISFTVQAQGSLRRVAATFTLIDGSTVTTTASITKRNAQNFLEMIVIMTQTEVYGEVNEVAQSQVGFGSTAAQQSVDLQRVSRRNGANIAPNRCGIVFGQGPNANFIGLVDEFALYENCQDINQVIQNF